MRQGTHHSAESRARIAAATKTAMADPAVRQRISVATKAGMWRANCVSDQVEALQIAWNSAGEQARQEFLRRILMGGANG